jgi:hypothetical protein
MGPVVAACCIVVAQAVVPEDPDTWFRLLNLFGWPTVFIIGLKFKWWHMGDPGVDPSWKEIAMRSIATNEEIVVELRDSRQRRRDER